jgi:NAD(P)-dependent dehydrogenase (short-subunit alcohol dehydrogenase family)
LTTIASSPQPPLSGQVAVVTGAGRGIGRAIALKLADLGARTILCGRSRPALEETATAIERNGSHRGPKKSSAKSTVIPCDVTDLAAVETLAAQVERTFDRLDILVNNAGVGSFNGPLHKLAPGNWDTLLNTNLRGVYYCIRGLVPLMIKTRGGHIINISSLAGKNALPNGAAYAASKWGLNGLTYSVAEELRAHGIRAAVICPGSTHTEFSPHAGMNTEKMLQAADIAHVVGMLVTQAPQSFASEVLLRPTQKP